MTQGECIGHHARAGTNCVSESEYLHRREHELAERADRVDDRAGRACVQILDPSRE